MVQFSFNFPFLGGVDFDTEEGTGGVTLGAVRVGGGPDGAEVGANLAVGCKVNNKGLEAKSGAHITIGREIRASAGASATASDKQAVAGARAGIDIVNGSTDADAGATTQGWIDKYTNDLHRHKKQLQYYESVLERNIKKVAAINSEIKKISKDAKQLENRKKTLYSEIAKGENVIATLGSKIRDFEFRLSVQESKLKNLATKPVEIEEDARDGDDDDVLIELNKVKETIENIKDEIDATKVEKDQKKKELDAKRQECEKVTKENNKVTQKLKEKKKELNVAEDELTKTKELVKRWKVEVKDSKEKVKESHMLKGQKLHEQDMARNIAH